MVPFSLRLFNLESLSLPHSALRHHVGSKRNPPTLELLTCVDCLPLKGMPTVMVKQAASNKMQFEQCELMECQESLQFEQCELMECQESLFSQTTLFLLVSRTCHSKEQAFYL
jgi:hypothetical protein